MQVLSTVWQHTMQRQTDDHIGKREPMSAQRQSARQGHMYKHERKTGTNSTSSDTSNAWSTGAAAETMEAVAKGRPSQWEPYQEQFQQQVAKMHGRSDKVKRVCLFSRVKRPTTALWSIGRYMVCEARGMFANSHEI